MPFRVLPRGLQEVEEGPRRTPGFGVLPEAVEVDGPAFTKVNNWA